MFDNLKKDYPSLHEDWNPTLVSADRIRWPGGNRLFASTVMISSGLCLLLIACANVAGLLLVRGSARQKEIATRLALGASRSRIVRQLLTEGLALSSLGLITGIAVCALTLKSLPQLQGTLGTPLDLGLSIDLRSLAIASAIALFSTLLFALTPALLASRVELTGALKDQGFLNTRPRKSRGRRILVSLQVFLSFVLLLAAGLFARTILHLEFVDPGFDRSVLLVKSDFLSVGFDRSQGIDFYNRSLDRIRELPGVRAASWAEDLPFTQPYGLWERIRPVPTGRNSEGWTSTDCNSITGDYFRTLGIPILQGRDITEQDFRRLAAVVVVNETLAHRYWPPGQAIGKRIQVKGFNSEVCEVVGVVKDAKYRTLWESGKPYAYFPFWLHLYFHMDLHVSAYGDPAPLVAPIRKACAAVNPGVTLDSPRLISTQIESLLAEERSAAFMLMTLGGLALVMAAAGLYGIVSYSASRRTREFGVRVALGARSWDILKQVMVEGLALALSGMTAGLLCSLILGRFLASRLHGLSPMDPLTYGTISLVCVFVAALAVFFPARKATKDPTRAVRCE